MILPFLYIINISLFDVVLMLKSTLVSFVSILIMTLRPISLHLCPMSNGLMLSFSPADQRALWLASDNSCLLLLLFYCLFICLFVCFGLWIALAIII